MDLEIPAEAKQVLPESKSDSNTSSSACTTEGSTWLENQSRDNTSSTDTGQNPTLNASTLLDKFLCNYPKCGQSFTHRHKLKYVYEPTLSRYRLVHKLTSPSRHRKYHFRLYRCLEPLCAAQQVAFSLKKDLIRHQRKHNGQRVYCYNAGCSSGKTGFTQMDNLKRHIAAQHPQV
jgi:hypothetical protein